MEQKTSRFQRTQKTHFSCFLFQGSKRFPVVRLFCPSFFTQELSVEEIAPSNSPSKFQLFSLMMFVSSPSPMQCPILSQIFLHFLSVFSVSCSVFPQTSISSIFKVCYFYTVLYKLYVGFSYGYLFSYSTYCQDPPNAVLVMGFSKLASRPL